MTLPREKSVDEQPAVLGPWRASFLAALLTFLGAWPVLPSLAALLVSAAAGGGLAFVLVKSSRPWARGAVIGYITGGCVGIGLVGLLLFHPYWSEDESRPQDVILEILLVGGLLVGAFVGGVAGARARKGESPKAERRVCPRCGSDTTFLDQEASVGWQCPRCGWGVATSNPRDVLLDETRFDLYVESGMPDRKTAIARAAAVLGTDLRRTRARMEAGHPLVEGVFRDEADSLGRRLAAAGLRFRVQPVPSASLERMRGPPPGASLGTEEAPPPSHRARESAVVPCDICGKPGQPRAHPSAPVTTMVLCDEHAASQSSFNPVTLLTGVIYAGVIAGVIWLLARLWIAIK
jgi:ribosomal protein S27AE